MSVFPTTPVEEESKEAKDEPLPLLLREHITVQDLCLLPLIKLQPSGYVRLRWSGNKSQHFQRASAAVVPAGQAAC